MGFFQGFRAKVSNTQPVWYKIVLVVSSVVTIVGMLLQPYMTSRKEEKQEKIELAESLLNEMPPQLQYVIFTDKLNRQLPTAVNDNLTLFKVDYEQKAHLMTFHYQLIGVSSRVKDEFQLSEWKKLVQNIFWQGFCSKFPMTMLADDDVTVVYHFYDKNRQLLFDQAKHTSQCDPLN